MSTHRQVNDLFRYHNHIVRDELAAGSNDPGECSTEVQQPRRPRPASVRPRMDLSSAPATCTDPYASRW
jgi:hypothetical protein